MLTPVDIENKEFTKAFRGYDVYEVEEFMKSLVADYEKLYRENGELKEKNALLNDAIGNYKGMEETMQNAILVAQRTAEDIKQNAYERSETIVKDAERRAAEAVNNANRSISHLEKTYLSMQQEMNGFKAKMSALLSTYMQLLSELPEQAVTQGRMQPAAPAEPISYAAPAETPVEAPAKAPVDVAAAKPTPAPADEPDQEDTNTFTLPLVTPPTAQETPAPPQTAAPLESSGFRTERKLNPVVEELLKKKKEEQQREEVRQTAEPDVKDKEPQPEETFSVTKDTIQKESKTVMSEINVEDLQTYDVFKDDTI